MKPFYLQNPYRAVLYSNYELSNFDHVLGVVFQTRVSGGNRIHDSHANNLAHYPLEYQGTHKK